MGRTYTTEEERDLTLPDDSIHGARLLEVKEREFEFRDRDSGQLKTGTTLEWWFEVTRPGAGLDDEYIGRRVRGECRPRITTRPGNRFREWAEALLDRPIPAGMAIDIDDLIGLPCEIVIGHRHDRKDATKVYEEVVGVLPAGPSASDPWSDATPPPF